MRLIDKSSILAGVLSSVLVVSPAFAKWPPAIMGGGGSAPLSGSISAADINWGTDANEVNLDTIPAGATVHPALLDGATLESYEVSGNPTLRIKAGGLSNSHLATSATIAGSKLAALKEHLPFTLFSPNANVAPLDYVKNGYTITDINCWAIGGGTISFDVQDCSAPGTCSSIGHSVTASSSGASATGFTSAISAGHWLYGVWGTPSGTVNSVMCAYDYTEQK